MKISKLEAEKMDKVLAYLINNNTAHVKSKQMQDILGIDFDEAKHIYHTILQYNEDIEPVISILFASNIAARPGITQEFLNRGGFTAVAIIESNLEVPVLSSEKRKSKKKIIIDTDKKATIALIISILAFILALVTIFFRVRILN